MVRKILLLFLLALCPTLALAASVQLAWDASVSSGVTGYRVYVGTSSQVYTVQYDAGTALTYEVPDLTVGTPYFFAVTAYDEQNNQSGFSNEVWLTLHTIEPPTNVHQVPLVIGITGTLTIAPAAPPATNTPARRK